MGAYILPVLGWIRVSVCVDVVLALLAISLLSANERGLPLLKCLCSTCPFFMSVTGTPPGAHLCVFIHSLPVSQRASGTLSEGCLWWALGGSGNLLWRRP